MPVATAADFAALGVPANLIDVLTASGITRPSPIQDATIPDALTGRDVLGRGRTGSGKTLAFSLPLVARLADGPRARPRTPRALVLAPTRELAGQIEAVLAPLTKIAGLSTVAIFGGVGQGPQVAALGRGVDVVVACPGRLEDLIKQGHCSLDHVQITVLDEADHMADLGFVPAVRRLLSATPRNGQRMLFSATLDKAVDALVRQFLTDPAVHEADSAQSPVTTMTHHVLQVERAERLAVLTDLASAPGRTVVFTRTKHGARALARQLANNGVPAVDLHGNLSQGARTRNMDQFHSGAVRTLVATDIAARGIHVDDVTLVIHADPPADHKAYLHRSGRTARAGNEGTVVTLMTREQTGEVRSLTRAAGINATTTRVASTSDPIMTQIAPGERVLTEPAAQPVTPQRPQRQGAKPGRGSSGARRQGSSSRGGSGDSRRSGSRGSSSRRSGRSGKPAYSTSSSGSPSGSTAHSAGSFSSRHR